MTSELINTPQLTASSVDIDNNLNRLVIIWNNNQTDQYPFVWLRDNCQCPECFDRSSQSRSTLFANLQLDSKPKNYVVQENNVEIQWEDDHKSAYDFGWLKMRSFNQNEQQKWLETHRAPYKTWIASDFKNIPTFDFQAIMKDDAALLEWLQILNVWGVSRLENVPNSLGQAGDLANRVGFLKRTHYENENDVHVKPDANNLAYTEGYLQLHTDLPVYDYMPGINILHCYIQASEGGDSIMADGFQVAELLRETDPDAYKVLTETEVAWFDIGHEKGTPFHKINQVPVICESSNHKVRRINYHNPQRHSHLPIPIDQVENWYRALKKFYGLALDPRNLVEFKLRPGQIVAFDNLRVLHGRKGFEETGKTERYIQGVYVDWDEARSKIRVLQAKFSSESN